MLKNLGFIMNTELSGTHHVNATGQKIYCVLCKLWFAVGFLQPLLKLKLSKSFIIAFSTYGANVHGVPPCGVPLATDLRMVWEPSVVLMILHLSS